MAGLPCTERAAPIQKNRESYPDPMVEWIKRPSQGVNMEMPHNDQIQTGIAVFSAMLFLVWVLPGLVCHKGKFPEDLPSRK
jgi:hypothetical protein